MYVLQNYKDIYPSVYNYHNNNSILFITLVTSLMHLADKTDGEHVCLVW